MVGSATSQDGDDQDSALDLSDASVRRTSMISPPVASVAVAAAGGATSSSSSSAAAVATPAPAPGRGDLVKQSLEDMISLQRSLIKQQSDKMASQENIINQQNAERQRQELVLQEQKLEIQQQKFDKMVQNMTIEQQNHERFRQENLLLEKDCKIAQQKEEKKLQQATIEQQNHDKLVQQHILVERERQIAQHSSEQKTSDLESIFTPDEPHLQTMVKSQLTVQCPVTSAASVSSDYNYDTPPNSSLTSSHQSSPQPLVATSQPTNHTTSASTAPANHVPTPLSPTNVQPECASLMCDSINELRDLISETSSKENHKVCHKIGGRCPLQPVVMYKEYKL